MRGDGRLPRELEPGLLPLSGAFTVCANRMSSVCERLARLWNVCSTRATCPPSAIELTWLISIPVGWSDGQLVVDGGNVPGAAQIVGMSDSPIATVVCSALKIVVYRSGSNPATAVRLGPGDPPRSPGTYAFSPSISSAERLFRSGAIPVSYGRQALPANSCV